MIQLKKINKSFINGDKKIKILKDISLNIKENDFITILGPSGSGKTTLLNIIGGLNKADSGKILYKNQDLTKLNDKELSHYRNHEIGFIFQEFNLEPNFKVLENILLPSYFNNYNKDYKTLAKKLLKEIGLEKKINSKINQLSGGQKQRIAIARALINNAKILIADEPTGNLDSNTGKLIIQILKKLHEIHKTTLIIATHDKEISKESKRKIHIIDGKIC